MIMNRDAYIAEAERQPNDTQFNEKLDENPQEQFRKDIDKLLKNIEISESTRENISSSESGKIPIFYVLPKIYKKMDSVLPFGYCLWLRFTYLK